MILLSACEVIMIQSCPHIFWRSIRERIFCHQCQNWNVWITCTIIYTIIMWIWPTVVCFCLLQTDRKFLLLHRFPFNRAVYIRLRLINSLFLAWFLKIKKNVFWHDISTVKQEILACMTIFANIAKFENFFCTQIFTMLNVIKPCFTLFIGGQW